MTFLDRFKNWAFRPPYEGILWLAWLYVVFACLVKGGGPFSGNLGWFDDYARMTQILGWVNGDSWYGPVISRVNAPEGFHTIWSRFVDLPVASIILALQGWIGQMHAAFVAATLLPLIQVLLLFQAAAWMAEPLLGTQKARLVILFVLFSSCINAEFFTSAGFQLGSIGHHAWYVLCGVLLAGAAARLVLLNNFKPVLIGAFAIAGFLVIGIEGLPLIAGICATLAVTACAFSRMDIAKRAAQMAALGALLGLILLPVNQPPDQFWVISFGRPSIFGPILAASAAMFFAAQMFLLKFWRRNKAIGFVLTAFAAGAVAASLIYFFPQILQGPASALSPEERKLAFAGHTEAMTLFKVALSTADFVRLVAPCLIALGFGVYFLRRPKEKDRRILYCAYFGFAFVPFALALGLSRYYHHAMVMACPWLALGCITLWQKLPNNKAAYLNRLLIFMALGPVWTVLAPAAIYNAGFLSDVLLFPAKKQTANELCDAKNLAVFLNTAYSPNAELMVPMYRSAEFLFYTKMHIVFLANFPSQNKFIDAVRFYETPNPNEAHAIALKHHINLVATCQMVPMHGANMQNFSLPHASSFNQQLLNGVIPGWLKPVPLNHIPTAYLLFEVKR